jgi:hypothetical protein
VRRTEFSVQAVSVTKQQLGIQQLCSVHLYKCNKGHGTVFADDDSFREKLLEERTLVSVAVSVLAKRAERRVPKEAAGEKATAGATKRAATASFIFNVDKSSVFVV